MTNIRHRERYNRLDIHIWKRTSVDEKGQTTLPKQVRRKIGLDGKKTEILWISVHHGKQDNIFLIIRYIRLLEDCLFNNMG